MTNISRRTAILSAVLTLLPWQVATVRAQSNWPAKPIRLVLPVAPGGATDAMVRLIQNPLSELLGQPVVIENRPGGAGVIAAETVKKAAPDGYSFAVIGTSFAANPALFTSLPYDTAKDFVPVAFLLDSITSWAVPASSPVADVAGLTKLAKDKPGSVAYGTGGIGQASHFSVAQFCLLAGVEMTHVPYRGAAPAVTDALAGHLPLVAATTSTVGAHVRDGKLRILAIASRDRSAIFPDVPTLQELGYPVVIGEFNALVAPAGTDPGIVNKMNGAIRAVLKRSEIASEYRRRDLVAYDFAPNDLQAFINDQANALADIIKRANIKPE